MTSSIRGMSCGHPVTSASLGWQGPYMAAQFPELVLPPLTRFFAASGVVSRPTSWREALGGGVESLATGASSTWQGWWEGSCLGQPRVFP